MPDALRIALYYVFPVIQDVILLLLFVRGVALNKQRKEAGKTRQVSLSPVLLWAGSACGVFFCALITVLGLNGHTSIAPWLVFEAFAVLNFAMLMAFCNETVVYDEESFSAKNIFGIKRTYTYGDISGIRRKGNGTVLLCGRRRVRLDVMAKNAHRFVQYSDSRYYRMFQKHIPSVFTRDPMRGNLDTPWLYLIFYLFCFAGGLIFILLSVNVWLPARETLSSDAFEIRASFASCKRLRKDGGTLVLNSEDSEKPFELSCLSGFEVPVPDSDILCNGTEYLVSVREGEKVYWIKALSTADHQVLLSAYDCNTAYRNSQLWAAIGIEVFSVLLIVFAVFGILVGRHPERFSKRVRNLFYKPYAWRTPDGE